MCTKSRRTRNIVRKGWRRDFFYDEDSLLITPLNQQSEEKQSLIDRLLRAKDVLQLSNYALADKIGVNEASVRRWLSGSYYPSEIQIPKIQLALADLEREFDGASVDASQNASADASVNASSEQKTATHQADSKRSLIYKEIKNIDITNVQGVTVIGNKNVVQTSEIALIRDNAKDVKRKAKSITTSRPKISLDDPCASCPANKEKSTRFVDGEGT